MSSGSFSSDVIGIKSIDTGHNSAGNGGNGYNWGNISDSAKFSYNPYNKADGADVKVSQEGDHNWAKVYADTTASQSNWVAADMHQTVMAGNGGNGGNDNKAEGGDVSFKVDSEQAILKDVLNNSEHFHVDDFVHV
jgi:hypothetical protein